MSDEIAFAPIGYVRGGRRNPVDDAWQGIEAEIVIDHRFGPDCLAGLGDFSHLDVVYVFHQVGEADIVQGARHPRGNPEWPRVGIFAQRAKARPNRLGVSTCRILGVNDLVIRVADLDALDGTPVLDVKPHMVEMGPRGPIREPTWVAELMAHYWE